MVNGETIHSPIFSIDVILKVTLFLTKKSLFHFIHGQKSFAHNFEPRGMGSWIKLGVAFMT